MKNENPTAPNNASLYQDGRHIHNHSQDPGYTMDPASQGLHGPGEQAANHSRARHMDNMANGRLDRITAIGGGLMLAGAAVLAWGFCTGRIHPFDTESTNGAR